MADKSLDGVKVAILVTDGFEQVELEQPRKALGRAGVDTKTASPTGTKVNAWEMTNWGSKFSADVALADADANDFDALLLPGGVINPATLRIIPEAVAFVRGFFDAGKTVAAICHRPCTMIEAGAGRGRRAAAWPSLKTDPRNAGAEWVDAEFVVNGNLVTSRKPDDIPAFNREMLALFARRPVAAR